MMTDEPYHDDIDWNKKPGGVTVPGLHVPEMGEAAPPPPAPPAPEPAPVQPELPMPRDQPTLSDIARRVRHGGYVAQEVAREQAREAERHGCTNQPDLF